MNNSHWFATCFPKPICVGAGLVALDVIVDEIRNSTPTLQAGGSCGNVMVSLSYLGWQTFPVARLRDDTASQKLIEDLVTWGVDTCLIGRSSDGSTPIIIETLALRPDGVSYHKFGWICPVCHSWLPRYKPVLAREVEQISKQMPSPQVFYFDRAVRSSFELAKINKARGAVIFFEPSAILDTKLFNECLRISDIVKYSQDRLERLPEHQASSLEVKTLGSEGLQYRFRKEGEGGGAWKLLPAFRIASLQDAAGAGDWCSAGLIQSVCGAGRAGFNYVTEDRIRDALNFGQALGAINCAFTGPRGSMYNLSKQEFEDAVRQTMAGKLFLRSTERDPSSTRSENTSIWQSVCSSCQSTLQAGKHIY